MTGRQFLILMLLAAAVVAGWSADAQAQAQACEDAQFDCKLKDGTLLGTISITCRMQNVSGSPMVQQCLPDIPITSMYKPLDVCKTRYPHVFEACPKQSWPSGYTYSHCMRYPSF